MDPREQRSRELAQLALAIHEGRMDRREFARRALALGLASSVVARMFQVYSAKAAPLVQAAEKTAPIVVTSGGIGGNHGLVRRTWPGRLGSPPGQMLSGVPEHVDGRMLAISQQAGARLINGDIPMTNPTGTATSTASEYPIKTRRIEYAS